MPQRDRTGLGVVEDPSQVKPPPAGSAGNDEPSGQLADLRNFSDADTVIICRTHDVRREFHCLRAKAVVKSCNETLFNYDYEYKTF
ncbi:hypothetical protein PTNB73_04695 [Pyrenophora teres f. teres]|nr:hypothetical protein HRS9139_04838 [Pyrenophora teres f. teres]KAE8869642.1 hypothetical protein PTNB73_04695 [Pyrenophora teres f. teres]